jgi:hypothetical protein
MNLHIEEPCHESWNKMTPVDKGRHCDSCCKTVIDFTNMPTDEVIRYITSKEKGSVCGRFTAGQVKVPAQKSIPAISWTFKKFLAAIVLVFGSALFTGCNEEPMGKLISMNPPVETTGSTQRPDTVIPKAHVKDTVPVKADTTRHFKGKTVCEENPKQETYYNGGVKMMEPEIVGLTVLEPEAGDTTR